MKKLLFAGFVVLVTAFNRLPDEGLTKSERSFAVDYLKKTESRLRKDVQGLSSDQLNFKADSSRWSVAQCVEHITLAENLIWKWSQGMLSQPANPSKRGEIKFSNEQLIAATVDRSKKFNAPDVLKPDNKLGSTEDALKIFTQRRDSTITYIQTTQDDLKNHFIIHPAMGTLDLYQALLFLSAHCERHTLQLEEVKANPNFPKN